MPAVTLLALFAGAAIVVGRARREPERQLDGTAGAAAIGAVAALAAVIAFVGLIGNIALARSGRALLERQGKAVVAEARTAHRWAPWSAQALQDLGEARS